MASECSESELGWVEVRTVAGCCHLDGAYHMRYARGQESNRYGGAD